MLGVPDQAHCLIGVRDSSVLLGRMKLNRARVLLDGSVRNASVGFSHQELRLVETLLALSCALD